MLAIDQIISKSVTNFTEGKTRSIEANLPLVIFCFQWWWKKPSCYIERRQSQYILLVVCSLVCFKKWDGPYKQHFPQFLTPLPWLHPASCDIISSIYSNYQTTPLIYDFLWSYNVLACSFGLDDNWCC